MPHVEEVTIMRRKLLLALAVLTLGGCAAYPYDPYYGDGRPYYANGYPPPQPYYGSPYYGPAYVAPSVGFGITYSDGYYHHHH
jgi:hypothetical protein